MHVYNIWLSVRCKTYLCRRKFIKCVCVCCLSPTGEETAGYTGKPLSTYKPASQMVPLGAAARLFCEAYLGRVDLPDARNSVTWSKVGSNVTLPNQGRISQHRVSRWVSIIHNYEKKYINKFWDLEIKLDNLLPFWNVFWNFFRHCCHSNLLKICLEGMRVKIPNIKILELLIFRIWKLTNLQI